MLNLLQSYDGPVAEYPTRPHFLYVQQREWVISYAATTATVAAAITADFITVSVWLALVSALDSIYEI